MMLILPTRLLRSRDGAWLVAALVLALAPALASSARAQQCNHFTPLRQPFFGDVHVHSALSFDAYGLQTRNGPRDAYRFATGEEVGLPPLDADGLPTRSNQLRRPLDFAAVTDHAEMLGETRLCTVVGLQTAACEAVREGPLQLAGAFFSSQFSAPDPQRRDLCGADDLLCLLSASVVWADLVQAAELWNDPQDDCSFSTFVGYEWTAAPGGNNLHRNVLFRSADVPAIPISYVEAQDPFALWTALDDQCAQVGGDCEAITIPHNSNQSNGQTFLTTGPDGAPLTRAQALFRRENEPLVELTQHKGDSECRIGVGTTDEGCAFEKISSVAPADDAPLSYVRNVLRAGLVLDAALGANPFGFGLIASSDSHNGTPGATREDDYRGHIGASDATPSALLSGGGIAFNPGGLMVLWAEENTRDALFDAMQRRESYATSGTRPELRFFAGFDLPPALCERADWVEQGYARGVPMGGELFSDASSAAPRFVVQASQDPGSPGFPGTRLAELQIVKGWLDASGTTQEQIVSVAGGPAGPDAVDALSCIPDGSGSPTLCGEWQDPDFDPDERAFYYARALESPTCRWSAQLCRAEGIDCSLPPPTGFEACCDGSVPTTIQERATSSPIWLRPVPEPGLGLLAGVGLLGLAGLVGANRGSGIGRARPGRPLHPWRRQAACDGPVPPRISISDSGGLVRDEVDREIEGLLRDAAGGPVPEPQAELVARTLQRIRGFVLLVDLLQLMTFEALWRSVSGADDDARPLEERQDQG